MNFFALLWNKIKRAFLDFINAAVPVLTQKFVVALREFGEEEVKLLDIQTITNEEKRKLAFDAIKAEALKKGIEFRDSAIYFLIEVAVQKLNAYKNERIS